MASGERQITSGGVLWHSGLTELWHDSDALTLARPANTTSNECGYLLQ